MMRALKWLGLGLTLTVLLAVGWVVRTVYFPGAQHLSLPERFISVQSAEGKALLGRAARADYDAVLPHFETQSRGSFCGVASAVATVNALSAGPVTQDDFFNDAVSEVKGSFAVTFGGMTLEQLSAMLTARGLDATAHHVSPDDDVAAFRMRAAANLARAGDVLVANYDRRKLDQKGGGHISPVVAYDARSDRLLVLDTASYKYAPHWIKTQELFDAMATKDSSVDAYRGYVVARRR